MAAIVVEFARFVEVQQRRARAIPERTREPRDTSAETNGTAPVADHRLDVGGSTREFIVTQSQTAVERRIP